MSLRSSAVTYYLDANHFCRLKITPEHDPERLEAALLLPETTGPHLLKRLLDHLTITFEDEKLPLTFQHSHRAEGQLPLGRRRNGLLQVTVDGQNFAQATMKAGHLEAFQSLLPPLTISELRMLGEFDSAKPYKRHSGALAEGLVFSDFHTHSSGELPGRDLIQIAAGHGLAYPVRLLKELKIDISPDQVQAKKVKRVIFPPMQEEESHLPEYEEAVPVASLTNNARKKLASAMDAPFDRQSTFANLERTCYRFRYPLAKQPELLVPTLMKIGENYHHHGIRYAEITMAGLEKPENLAAIHEAVPRIKAKYGVDLRFLIGIPRTMDRSQLHPLIEKTKILAESPYIMGADIIGYETNKTSYLMEELESLARWVHESGHKEFTLRVHAGENAKNPDNVYEVLKLTEKHKVRVRVGHALHGLDSKSLDLAATMAKQGLVVLEFNPDSNIALNNMDRLEELPCTACRERAIDYVLGTDGSGIYGTSPQQLGLSAVAGLMDRRDQIWLISSQRNLVDSQLQYSKAKQDRCSGAYKNDKAFVAHLVKSCAAVRSAAPDKQRPQLFINSKILPVKLVTHDRIAEAFGGLTPVVLAGASGSSWARMTPEGQRETAVAVDLMASLLDPAKVMFVHGRGKERGIVAELAKALHPPRKSSFTVLGMITEEHWRELLGERSMAPHITHAGLIPRGFLYVPEALVSLAKDRQGIVVAAGGAAFTRDVVLNARQAGLPVMLLECAEGASRAKAAVMPESAVADARELARALYRRKPELFREPLNEASLETAYQHSQALVEGKARQAHRPAGNKAQKGV